MSTRTSYIEMMANETQNSVPFNCSADLQDHVATRQATSFAASLPPICPWLFRPATIE
jgi:hypothetical protein